MQMKLRKKLQSPHVSDNLYFRQQKLFKSTLSLSALVVMDISGLALDDKFCPSLLKVV